MTDTRYKDADWLEEQYHEKELTLCEIADKCDVSTSTIYRWMEKHDIEVRDASERAKRVGVGVFSHKGYRRWNESSLNKKVYVHRLLAVAEHGFDAVCDMDVHHKNGIRWDNRPDNIELLTRSEHSRHHSREQHDYCDVRYRDAKWLREQYHENGLSTCEIAAMCGVSHQTVNQWMQKHDVERRDRTEYFHSDTPTGQLTLDDTRKLEGAQTVNQ